MATLDPRMLAHRDPILFYLTGIDGARVPIITIEGWGVIAAASRGVTGARNMTGVGGGADDRV